VLRNAWGDSEHCPSAALNAANDNIFSMASSDQVQLFQRGGWQSPPPRSQPEAQNFLFKPAAISAESPVGEIFAVNSKPHTVARPSVRLSVGKRMALEITFNALSE
jgi:hypothetical protein